MSITVQSPSPRGLGVVTRERAWGVVSSTRSRRGSVPCIREETKCPGLSCSKQLRRRTVALAESTGYGSPARNDGISGILIECDNVMVDMHIAVHREAFNRCIPVVQDWKSRSFHVAHFDPFVLFLSFRGSCPIDSSCWCASPRFEGHLASMGAERSLSSVSSAQTSRPWYMSIL